MAEGKKSFIAYSDWNEMFKELPDEVAGKLIKYIFAYVNDENPDTDDFVIKALFGNIKTTLKRDLDKWNKQREQRSKAGKKSAEKRKSTSVESRSTKTNERTRNPTVSVNVNDNDIYKDSVSQNETTFLYKNIYDLDKDKTLPLIKNDKEKLYFRMAKALNNYFVDYCKQKGIKVKSSIKNAKASAEMNQMRLLLKDYSEQDIKQVMVWLINGKTPDAQFWQKNVFSCSGFRSKFEKMKLALETKPKQKQIQRL